MNNWIESRNEGPVGVITLNRPDALNALSHAMINTIKNQLLAWQDDDAIQCVFVHGKGRAFCAGGDVRSLYGNGIDQVDKTMAFFRDEYSLNQLIHHYEKPYISYWDGIAMGGGLGISLHGSHRIATENTVFAMPETHIGFFPDVGIRHYLTKLPDHIGLYLSLTGNRLTGSQAKALGLATHFCTAGKSEEIIQALAHAESIEAALNPFQQTPPRAELIDASCYQHNSLPAIWEALQAAERSDELANKSLFSLETTLDSYQNAIGADFDSIIDGDLAYAQACITHPDFYEGIRAMLIDKDRNPAWKQTFK